MSATNAQADNQDRAEDAALVVLEGWHTAAAITYAEMNRAIKAHGIFPPSFDHAAPDGSCSVHATFDAWEMAIGGAGPLIRMALHISGGTLMIGTASHPVAPCVAAIEVQANFIDRPAAAAKQDLVLDSTTPVTVSDCAPPQPNFMVEGVFHGLLQEWLNANLEQFQHVFATVDFDADFANEGVSWLKPSFHGYAVVEPMDNKTLDNCAFGVLCMIDGAQPTAHMAQQLPPFIIPAGRRAGFAISPDKFLHHMMLAALPLMFKDIDNEDPLTNFEIVGAGTTITNSRALTFRQIELADGTTCEPVVTPGNFTMAVSATELIVSSVDLTHSPSAGITAHLNQHSRQGIRYDKTIGIMDVYVIKQTGDGHLEINKAMADTAMVLAWSSLGLTVVAGGGMIAGKLAAGVAGRATEAAEDAVGAGTRIVLDSEETGAMLEEEMATSISALSNALSKAGNFASIAQIAATVSRVAGIAAFATSLMPVIYNVVKAMDEKDYNSLPKIADLTDGAIGRVVNWPEAVGVFKLVEMQLNHSLQFGFD